MYAFTIFAASPLLASSEDQSFSPDIYKEDDVRQLYPPGRILHFVETAKDRWFPKEEDQEKFTEIAISTKMMAHHMPNFVAEKLKEVCENYEKYSFHTLPQKARCDTSYTTELSSDANFLVSNRVGRNDQRRFEETDDNTAANYTNTNGLKINYEWDENSSTSSTGSDTNIIDLV